MLCTINTGSLFYCLTDNSRLDAPVSFY